MSANERQDVLRMQLALTYMKKDVDLLFKAVQDGIYDSRSIVGDASLRMSEELDNVKDLLYEKRNCRTVSE